MFMSTITLKSRITNPTYEKKSQSFKITRYMGHLSIADVPPTIISLAASDSESELEFYSEEDLDSITYTVRFF
jgi:hypothetical protein